MTQEELKDRLAALSDFRQCLMDAVLDTLPAATEPEQRNEILSSIMTGAIQIDLAMLLAALDKYRSGIKQQIEPEFKSRSDFGDYMTIREFIAAVKCKAYVDSDGFGYYCVNGLQSDVEVKPSDVVDGEWDKRFTHVNWFNK